MASKQKSPIMKVLAACIEVAEIGADVIREVSSSQKDLGQADKGGIMNVQTDADRNCERVVKATLLSMFPQITFVGEENEPYDAEFAANLPPTKFDHFRHKCPLEYEDVSESDVTLWVDPLDGTACFVQGLLDQVTVMIGISVRGKPVAGVINQPFYKNGGKFEDGGKLGRSVWGMNGLGVHGLKGEALSGDSPRVETCAKKSTKRLITSMFRRIEAVESVVAELKTRGIRTETTRQGGAGNKVLAVLEDEADVWLHPVLGCRKWDLCAPQAILEAAGGSLTTCDGGKVDYSCESGNFPFGGVVASLRGHDDVISLICDEVKKKLSK